MSSYKRDMRRIISTAKQHRVPSEVTFETLFNVLSSLDCPRALTVYLLFREGEHQQLAQLEANPVDYATRQDFRDAYAATKLLSKAVFLNLPYDKRLKALEKFEEFERLCKQTNQRFRDLTFDSQFCGPNVWLLNAVIRKIERILGRWDTDEMLDRADWGPGVTTLIQGDGTSAVNKFQCETGTTRDLYALLPLDGFPFIYPGWQAHLKKIGYPSFQVGNKVITVPKDAKADRVIAVEPGLNLWFQKGIGSIIRRKLFRAGIDLNTQERNQQLARRGSETHTLATIDFSSASDSIARNLVREILPPDWFQVMDAVRSHYGLQNKIPVHWEKFSSMGNGFTFELESLIFFAAADAVVEFLGETNAYRSEVSVYGDDVIIPVTCVELFSSFCAFLGFKVNPEKSFSSGYFRESCGRHYWDGVDVTPIYLKQMASSALAVYRLANAIRVWAHRRNNTYGCDSSLRKCWTHLFNSLPEVLRLTGSYGKGDGSFVVNFDESNCVKATSLKGSYLNSGIEGYLFVAISGVGVTRFAEGDGLLFARLRSTSSQEYGNFYTLRGRVRIKVHLILTQQWYDLGPWF